MLILNRKPGQKIIIGSVILTVLETSNSRVRLGFEAPDDLRILRGELLEKETEYEVRDRETPT